MKSLKAICALVILTLALGVPAYAGDIEMPGKPAPITGSITKTTTTPETTPTLSQPTTEAGITVLSYIFWALASIY
jgi:hypothetical protein